MIEFRKVRERTILERFGSARIFYESKCLALFTVRNRLEKSVESSMYKSCSNIFTLNAKHQSFKLWFFFRFKSIFGDSSPEALFNQIDRSPGTY